MIEAEVTEYAAPFNAPCTNASILRYSSFALASTLPVLPSFNTRHRCFGSPLWWVEFENEVYFDFENKKKNKKKDDVFIKHLYPFGMIDSQFDALLLSSDGEIVTSLSSKPSQTSSSAIRVSILASSWMADGRWFGDACQHCGINSVRRNASTVLGIGGLFLSTTTDVIICTTCRLAHGICGFRFEWIELKSINKANETTLVTVFVAISNATEPTA